MFFLKLSLALLGIAFGALLAAFTLWALRAMARRRRGEQVAPSGNTVVAVVTGAAAIFLFGCCIYRVVTAPPADGADTHATP
jgi:hypothetical protein